MAPKGNQVKIEDVMATNQTEEPTPEKKQEVKVKEVEKNEASEPQIKKAEKEKKQPEGKALVVEPEQPEVELENKNQNISAKEMEAERQKLREQMNKVEKNISIKKEAKTGNLKVSDLHLGDGVQVLSMNIKGTVSTLPDAKGYLFVQMGIMRSKIHISDFSCCPF